MLTYSNNVNVFGNKNSAWQAADFFSICYCVSNSIKFNWYSLSISAQILFGLSDLNIYSQIKQFENMTIPVNLQPFILFLWTQNPHTHTHANFEGTHSPTYTRFINLIWFDFPVLYPDLVLYCCHLLSFFFFFYLFAVSDCHPHIFSFAFWDGGLSAF